MLPEIAGGGAGEGAEDPGEVVVVADAHLLRHGGDGQVALEQEGLGGVDAPLGDDVGQGAPPGELLGQAAELGAADVQVGGDGFQTQLVHVVLLQVQLQLLQVRSLRGLDHALELDVGGQGLQQLGVGLQLLGGVLPELEKGAAQRLRPAGVPVQSGAGARPLRLHRAVVQKAAEDQVGQGVALVVEDTFPTLVLHEYFPILHQMISSFFSLYLYFIP